MNVGSRDVSRSPVKTAENTALLRHMHVVVVVVCHECVDILDRLLLLSPFTTTTTNNNNNNNNSTSLLAGVKAGRVHLCRVACNTV